MSCSPNRYITPVVTRVANLLLQLPEDAAGVCAQNFFEEFKGVLSLASSLRRIKLTLNDLHRLQLVAIVGHPAV